MNNVTVKVTPSFNELAKAFSKAGKDVTETARKFLSEFALTTESYSKQVTPVDTGRLRSSIATSFPIGDRGTTAEVGTHNVKYARFVHDGTRRIRERPFMKFGLEFAVKKFNDRSFANRLDNSIRQSLSKL